MKTSARVLVCEDDAFLRDMLASHLRQEGHEVIEAENGFESLHQLIKSPPDLLLLDIQMPRMDGKTLLKQMKQVGLHVPVFVLTGMKDPSLEEELLKAGVKEVIHKPYDVRVVSNFLRHLH